MNENLLRTLMLNQDNLSAAEQKITNVIMKNPKQFTTYSLTELAKIADVSQGSIINFSNKFAGGGFPTLKLKIAMSQLPSETFFSGVNKSDNLKTVFQKRIENVYNAMEKALNENDENVIQLVADKILNAKKVELYGIYRSAVITNDFFYQLLLLGIPVSVISDALTCATSAYMLNEGSVVFAVSSSGRSKDVLDAVKVAKSRGVYTIGLTSFKNSPLTKLCDTTLFSPFCGYSVSGSDTEARFSQMIIIDTICSYIRSKIDVTGEDYYKLRQILTLHSVDD